MIVMFACSGPAHEIPLPDLTATEAPIVAAVHHARGVVRDDPNSAAAWGALGDRYYVHEWFLEAAVCYRRAEQLQPEMFDWSYLQGHSLLSEARAAESLEAFDRALAIESRYAPSHVVYGQAMQHLGREDEARSHFVLASRLDPTSSHAELGLGQLAMGAGDFQAALDHLKEALRRRPDHGEAHHAIARTYAALGDREMAEYHAERTRELPKITPKPDSIAVPNVEAVGSVALEISGRSYLAAGRYDLAARQFLAALEINPECQPCYAYLGAMLTHRGHWDEALEMLREAERLQSTDILALENLAHVLEQQGKSEEAAHYASRASSIRGLSE
jgi:tetratricopeptide (TPR) repeat protein